jgi:uncharacterized membrane protein
MNWKLIYAEGDCSSLTGYFVAVLARKKEEPRVEHSNPQVRICNRTGEQNDISVVGYKNGKWVKRGWFHVYSGKCVTFIEFIRGMFYIFAWNQSGERRGNMPICIDTRNGFDEIQSGGECYAPYEVKLFKGYLVESDITLTID